MTAAVMTTTTIAAATIARLYVPPNGCDVGVGVDEIVRVGVGVGFGV